MSCSEPITFDVTTFVNGTTPHQTVEVPVHIVAGSTVSAALSTWNAYEGRSQTPWQGGLQDEEAVTVVVRMADGTTWRATTPDLADGVESASWTGTVGTFTPAADVVGVRIVHASTGGYDSMSFGPLCLTVTPPPPPTTTTTMTPTTAAPTPTTAAPPPPTTVEPTTAAPAPTAVTITVLDNAVTAPVATVPVTTRLPETGVETLGFQGGLATVLVVVGAGLVARARRRHDRRTAGAPV